MHLFIIQSNLFRVCLCVKVILWIPCTQFSAIFVARKARKPKISTFEGTKEPINTNFLLEVDCLKLSLSTTQGESVDNCCILKRKPNNGITFYKKKSFFN